MATTNYISQIKDTAGTTHDIQQGVSTRIFRGTCPTAAGQSPKIVTLDDDTQYSLTTGVRIAVTFTYGNSITTPSLNVGGTSKTIAFPTAVATRTTGNGTTYNLWGPYETVIFTYDGTYWVHSGSALSIYNAYALADSKTANTGTVTQVTAGTGLSINQTSGGNFTTSGTINHTNSVTAQTTQAVYPIKIDAQGHISAYGTAVTIPDVSGKIDTAGTGLSKSGTTLNHTNSVTAQTTQAVYPIKIDAQGHISAYGDAVIIPNVTSTAVTAATTNYIVGSTVSSTTTGTLSKHASAYLYTSADSGTGGSTRLTLGNTTATSSAGGKEGQIRLYGTNATYYVDIKAGAIASSSKTLTLPNKTDTLAVLGDIPDVSGKIDTGGTGLSKSGTTLNHSNSVTAQTTQAVYPITIDAQGHISAYGSAVTIPEAAAQIIRW